MSSGSLVLSVLYPISARPGLHSTVKPRVNLCPGLSVWSGPVFSWLTGSMETPIDWFWLPFGPGPQHSSLSLHIQLLPWLNFSFKPPLPVFNEQWTPSIPHLPNHAYHLIYFQEFTCLWGVLGQLERWLHSRCSTGRRTEVFCPWRSPAYMSVSKSPFSFFTHSINICWEMGR